MIRQLNGLNLYHCLCSIINNIFSKFMISINLDTILSNYKQFSMGVLLLMIFLRIRVLGKYLRLVNKGLGLFLLRLFLKFLPWLNLSLEKRKMSKIEISKYNLPIQSLLKIIRSLKYHLWWLESQIIIQKRDTLLSKWDRKLLKLPK